MAKQRTKSILSNTEIRGEKYLSKYITLALNDFSNGLVLDKALEKNFIDRKTFFIFLGNNSELLKRYKDIQSAKREEIRHKSLDIIDESLNSEDIGLKEKTEFAFRFLEKTDNSFNKDTKKEDGSGFNINFNFNNALSDLLNSESLKLEE